MKSRRSAKSSALLCAGLAACGMGGTAEAQSLTTVQVAQVSQPVHVAAPREDFSRAFIATKGGAIRVLALATNTLLTTPFLTVPEVLNAGEQGLLAMVFHPDYETNGYFYVAFNHAPDGNTLLVRYSRSLASPEVADPNSALIVLRIDRPPGFHNGGWLAFGNDGYLYMSAGDRSNPGLAQNLAFLHGKLLRIDVDGDDFPADPEANYRIPPGNPIAPGGFDRPEIWCWGLRNPWRCGFDRATGGMFIADVGQQEWEEISYLPPGASGLNFGWPCLEGIEPWLSASGCEPPNPLLAPIVVYGHNQIVEPTQATGCAITGGEVYRGCAIPELGGTYFFGDFCSGAIFSLRYDGTTMSEFTNRTAELESPNGSIVSPSSFGTDAFGELYICDMAGAVYKIVRDGAAGPDCNDNQLGDSCEILVNPGLDQNHDGLLDECEAGCAGDVNGDGHTTLTDLALLLISFGACDGADGFNPAADLLTDGCVNLGDLAVLLADFGC